MFRERSSTNDSEWCNKRLSEALSDTDALGRFTSAIAWRSSWKLGHGPRIIVRTIHVPVHQEATRWASWKRVWLVVFSEFLMCFLMSPKRRRSWKRLAALLAVGAHVVVRDHAARARPGGEQSRHARHKTRTPKQTTVFCTHQASAVSCVTPLSPRSHLEWDVRCHELTSWKWTAPLRNSDHLALRKVRQAPPRGQIHALIHRVVSSFPCGVHASTADAYAACTNKPTA